MADILQFPGVTRITPEELLEDLRHAIAEGKVEHLLFVTMGPNTAVDCGMTTSSAHIVTYMNNYQRLRIEGLMREKGMIP